MNWPADWPPEEESDVSRVEEVRTLRAAAAVETAHRRGWWTGFCVGAFAGGFLVGLLRWVLT